MGNKLVESDRSDGNGSMVLTIVKTGEKPVPDAVMLVENWVLEEIRLATVYEEPAGIITYRSVEPVTFDVRRIWVSWGAFAGFPESS
jgi:hypothetical protein